VATFIPALFASISSGVSAAGTAITSATGFSASSILSGAATAAGALATIGASRARAADLKMQAAETRIEATGAEAQSLQKQGAMKRELMRILGENHVATAAAGLDIGSGIGAQTDADVQGRATTELSIERSTQDARRAMYRARAAGLRSMARQAKRSGYIQAFGQVAQGGADFAARGERSGAKELY
jgi:hypothetical protein